MFSLLLLFRYNASSKHFPLHEINTYFNGITKTKHKGSDWLKVALDVKVWQSYEEDFVKGKMFWRKRYTKKAATKKTSERPVNPRMFKFLISPPE